MSHYENSIRNYDSYLENFPGNVFSIFENDKYLLISEEMFTSKSTGSYFTPNDLISSVFSTINFKYSDTLTILDPAMGSGRFFIAFLDLWFSSNLNLNKHLLNYIIEYQFFGTDLDNNAITFAKLKIALIDLYLATKESDWDVLEYKFQNWEQMDIITDLIDFSSPIVYKIGSYSKKKLKTVLKSEIFNNSIKNQGFSLVVANPPYYKVGKTKYKNHPLYKRVKYSLSHVTNISNLFLQLGLYLVSPKGYLSYILPKGFNYNLSFKLTREQILSLRLLKLIDCRKSFKNVLLEQVFFIIKNEPLITNQVTDVYRYETKTSVLKPIGNVYQKLFSQIFHNRLTFYVNNIGIDLFLKLVKKSIFLENIQSINNKSGKISIFMGNSNNTILKKHSKNSGALTENIHPILWGKLISRFSINPQFIDLSEISILKKKSLKKYKQSKIVVQRIIAHIKNHIKITAAYDDIGCLTVNTITNITFEEHEIIEKPLWNCKNFSFILLLLNSQLLNFIVHKFYFSDAIRSMDLSSTVLGKFLIPTLNNNHQKEILNQNSIKKQEDTLYDLLGLTRKEKEYLQDYVNN